MKGMSLSTEIVSCSSGLGGCTVIADVISAMGRSIQLSDDCFLPEPEGMDLFCLTVRPCDHSDRPRPAPCRLLAS